MMQSDFSECGRVLEENPNPFFGGRCLICFARTRITPIPLNPPSLPLLESAPISNNNLSPPASLSSTSPPSSQPSSSFQSPCSSSSSAPPSLLLSSQSLSPSMMPATSLPPSPLINPFLVNPSLALARLAGIINLSRSST